jgi:serine/threonine-protein kinase
MRSQVVESVYRVTRSGVVPGEYVYQPPEMFRGDETVGPPSDVYSLAACLYQALTLRPPFDPSGGLKPTMDQVMNDLVTPPDQINPDVAPALSDLLLKSLAKDPAERPPSAQSLLESITKIEELGG